MTSCSAAMPWKSVGNTEPHSSFLLLIRFYSWVSSLRSTSSFSVGQSGSGAQSAGAVARETLAHGVGGAAAPRTPRPHVIEFFLNKEMIFIKLLFVLQQYIL